MFFWSGWIAKTNSTNFVDFKVLDRKNKFHKKTFCKEFLLFLTIFWKNAYMKIRNFWMKYLEKVFFFFFQLYVFLIFVKIWTPVFTFYIWLMNLWRNNEHMFWEFSLGKPIDFHLFKMSCLTCLVFSCVCCFFLKRWNYKKRYLFCMNKLYFCRNFFLTDWCHNHLKITVDLLLFYGEHFYGFSESDISIIFRTESLSSL